MKCKSIISEMENDTQEYICATGECSFRKRNWENRGGQISGRGKLYNFEEEEAEIAENELVELNNRKEVANKEEVEEISITQEEKEKEKKELKTK